MIKTNYYKKRTFDELVEKYVGHYFGAYVVTRVLQKNDKFSWSVELRCSECGFTFETSIHTVSRYSRHEHCNCDAIRKHMRTLVLRSKRETITTQLNALEAIFNNVIKEKRLGLATN